MDIKEKSTKGLTKEFEIKFKKEDVGKLVNEKLVEISSQANLPGFRPGKVPLSILKTRFGKQIYGEVVNESINNATKKIIEDYKINAVSQPKLDIESFEEGKDLLAKMTVEIMPTFKTPDLSSLQITRPVAKVLDNDIEEAIDKIAKENIKTETIKEKRGIIKGDTAVIDFEGKIDNVPFEGGNSKGYHLKIGSNMFIPGFEEKLIGAKLEDQFPIDLVFPKDYQAKDLAGKKVTFEVKINDIRHDIENTIDDNFAKSLGLDDLETLKKNVRNQIVNQHQATSRLKAKKIILDKLADLGDFDLPPSLGRDEYLNVCRAMNINSKTDNQLEVEKNNNNVDPEKGMSEEEKRDAKAISVRRVRLGLILAEIGRENNIKVEEEDTRNAMMREVQNYPGKEKEILDYFKNNPEAKNELAGPIFEDKIIDFILELANVKDKEVSVDELYKEDEFDLKKEADKAKKSVKKEKKSNLKKNKKDSKKNENSR